MRLVQLIHEKQGRKVAVVIEPKLQVLSNFTSLFEVATKAINGAGNIRELIQNNLTDDILDYDSIYAGTSDWKLLPAFDHPTDVNKLMVSGTGLTHKASAENRQKMHEAKVESELTDSMKMYLMGLEGGHPEKDGIGVQPEWFYKGNGSILKAHGDSLTIPEYGDDGGEEPEIAGIYICDSQGKPWRIGFATANEFSDHVMERKNYLYLAPSKIRNCSLGPEMVLTDDFDHISGKVSIVRTDVIHWEKAIKTGEKNMAHSLANLEYHHFKYENHRQPGQAHVHFFGADAFSFGEKITLKNNDTMIVQWHAMGRPLKNRLEWPLKTEKIITIGIVT